MQRPLLLHSPSSLQGMSFLPSIMNNKLKLDAMQGADHDATLRQWADRVRAQAGSLVGMKGPQLDMQLTFSQRWVGESKIKISKVSKISKNINMRRVCHRCAPTMTMAAIVT